MISRITFAKSKQRREFAKESVDMKERCGKTEYTPCIEPRGNSFQLPVVICNLKLGERSGLSPP